MDNSIAQFIPPFFQGLLVATGCGLVMGLERAFNSIEDEHAAGIRTFPITSILGYIMVFIARHFNDWLLIASIPAIFIFITAVHVITISGLCLFISDVYNRLTKIILPTNLHSWRTPQYLGFLLHKTA
jgi:MgtC family